MLQPITFAVTREDGTTVSVTAHAPEYAAYEERFNRSIVVAMNDSLWSAYTFCLWHAMRRQGMTELEWGPFLESNPQWGREIVSEVPVPLDQAAPPGPSPDSP